MSKRRRRNERPISNDRNKYIAALLAILVGSLGVHQFYLGRNKRGVLYIILTIFTFGILSTIASFIDFILLLVQSEIDFDRKYNQEFQEWNYQSRRERRTDRGESRTARTARRERSNYRKATHGDDHKVNRKRKRDPEFRRPKRRERTRVKPGQTYKSEGIRKFKEYDIQGSIIDFEKALKAAPSDPATHFNLACAYSLTENKEESFYHLSKAVKHGFTDIDRISTHEALAFMRIQDNWIDFVEQGYTLSGGKQKEDNHVDHSEDSVPSDLLDQLNKLKDLRDRGLLTQEEFMIQKTN